MKNIKKFLIISLFLGILAAAPGFISQAQAAGLTQSQIDAIIGLLQSFGADQTTINNVNSALTGAPVIPPSAVWCHDFNVNLKIGDKGSEVEALQIVLQKKEGFDIPHLMLPVVREATFEEETAAAVSGFQQKYASEILTPLGLKYGTGFVGKATRAKLNALYGCSSKIEKQIGYIKSVYDKNGKRYLDIDYIQWFSGEDAIQEAIKDTSCSREKIYDCVASLNNGFYIKNQNPQIRIFEISSVVQIRAFQGGIIKDISYEEFKKGFYPSESPSHYAFENIPFHIEILNGVVVKITEQYLP